MTQESENGSINSWIDIPDKSDFSIHNLPYGVFAKKDGSQSCATRLGNTVIDLNYLQQLGYLTNADLPEHIFSSDSLNPFIKQGRHTWKALKSRLINLFDETNPELRDQEHHRKLICSSIEDVTMQLPIKVGDYTDFYSSREHAINVGKMFRPNEPPLKPNWTHMPIAYHGRSSTIASDAQKIMRPSGQILNSNETPELSKSKNLDIELEMGFITGDANLLGEPVPVDEAHQHIFGMVLLNDWSARDIQKWEYVPLGPFLGKNFATTISPWVVTMDALKPFKTNLPLKKHEPLPYLSMVNDFTYDIKLEVDIVTNKHATTIIKSNYKYLYWSMSQQLAHHTVNGCKINAGDLMGSGTISGPTQESFGSLLELSWAGTRPIHLNDGTTRTFLQDGDTIMFRGYCEKDDVRIGFGKLSNQVIS